jgi:hypothetical protein
MDLSPISRKSFGFSNDFLRERFRYFAMSRNRLRLFSIRPDFVIAAFSQPPPPKRL